MWMATLEQVFLQLQSQRTLARRDYLIRIELVQGQSSPKAQPRSLCRTSAHSVDVQYCSNPAPSREHARHTSHMSRALIPSQHSSLQVRTVGPHPPHRVVLQCHRARSTRTGFIACLEAAFCTRLRTNCRRHNSELASLHLTLKARCRRRSSTAALPFSSRVSGPFS